MANHGTVDLSTSLDLAGLEPLVEIDGIDYSGQIECLQIQGSTGFSRMALLKCMNVRDTEGSPLVSPDDIKQQITLNNLDFGTGTFEPTFGRRVRVYVKTAAPAGVDGDTSSSTETGQETTLFLGHIQSRHDLSATNSIIVKCVDDVAKFSEIPIIGALIRTDTGRIIYSKAEFARTNPSGYWNCTGALHNGVLYPVFTPGVASRGKTYESPDELFVNDLADGQLTAWTPRRFLQYLQFMYSLGFNDLEVPDIAGMQKETWRTIKNSKRLGWRAESITAMVGVDPSKYNPESGSPDPLDKKMPDVSFQGGKLSNALNDTLNIAQTHGFVGSAVTKKETVGDTTTVTHKTFIEFYTRGYSALGDDDFFTIPLKRDGSVADATDNLTIYEFEVIEDTADTYPVVVQDGARVHLESRFAYEGDRDNDALVPAWSAADEERFLWGVNGGLEANLMSKRFAVYPRDQDTTSTFPGEPFWLIADGEDGRPLAHRRTPEAVALLRQNYPRVFKAFRVVGGNIPTTITNGADDKFEDQEQYPFGEYNRPILPTQSQFFLSDVNRDEKQENWLLTKYPVRVEIKNNADDGGVLDGWHDAGYAQSLRMTADGLLWFDQYAESVNGSESCLYSGSMFGNTANIYRWNDVTAELFTGVKLRQIRINASIPYDHRVRGVASGSSPFTQDFDDDLGGAAIMYIDSPNAFREEHQKGSFPAPINNYFAGDSGDPSVIMGTDGLDRILSPGTEEDNAEFAAQRKLAYSKNPSHKSTWKMPGIKYQYYPGQFITGIRLVYVEEQDPFSVFYSVRAPIESIIYDFENQETRIDGLFSQLVG